MFPHLAKFKVQFLQSFKFKLFHCLQKQAAFLVLSEKKDILQISGASEWILDPEHF